MITPPQAWERFQRSVEQMDRWLTAYEERYKTEVERLVERKGLTPQIARYTIDSTPSYDALLTYQLGQYKWYREEAKVWKDIWQALTQYEPRLAVYTPPKQRTATQ